MFRFLLSIRFDASPSVVFFLKLLICSAIFHSGVIADEIPRYLADTVGEGMLGVRDCTKKTKPSETTTLPAKARVSHHASHAKDIEVDHTCLSSVDKVHKEWKQGNALLLDVRSPQAYRGNRIPGSVNLPLYTIKYKSGFKNRNIILVNKGPELRLLQQTCGQLKQRGFNQVSILEGGLKSWVDNGYAVQGDNKSLVALSDLTPSEYTDVALEREWVFIDLDHSSEEMLTLSSITDVIEHLDDFSALTERIDAARVARAEGKPVSFLVISRTGKDYNVLRNLFLDHAIKDIYFLSGGVSGLMRYKRKHSAQIERQRKGFQVRMGCNG